jgi:Tfp pilus assembly protein PilN
MPGDPRVAGVAGAGVLFLVLAAFLWWRTGSARAELMGKVDQAVSDSTRLARTISLMQQMDARRDTMERKIDAIRSVDGRRYIWPHLLDEISRAVPQYTWLVKVSTEEEEPPPPPPTRGTAPMTAADSAKARADSAALPAVVVPPGPTFTLEGNTGSTQALTRLMKNLEASPMIREVALVTSEQANEQGRTFLKFTLEAQFEEPDSALIETVPVMTPTPR